MRLPELRGHSLAVVATNPDGTIADFSNRCGIAKAFCLAAPGVDITGTAPAFPLRSRAHRSVSSRLRRPAPPPRPPFVTGGIGLLAQHFRDQLGNDEIVERILATADRTGVYADADVYGQGFLDLDAATRPVGQERMLTGVSLSGASSPEAESALYLGPAFGDSLVRGLASAQVASFDELDAPFFRRLGDYLRPAGSADSTLRRAPESAGARSPGNAVAGGRAQVAGAPRRRPGRARRRCTQRPGRRSLGACRWGNWRERDRGGGEARPRSRRCRLRTTSAAAGSSSATAPGWTRGSAWVRESSRRARSPTPAHSPIRISAWPATGPASAWRRPWARAPLRIAAFAAVAQNSGRRDSYSDGITGAFTEYRFGGLADSGLSLQGGWLSEANGAVGSRPDGAFGEFGTGTVLAGLSASRRLGGSWTLLGSAHAGVHRTDNLRQGIVQGGVGTLERRLRGGRCRPGCRAKRRPAGVPAVAAAARRGRACGAAVGVRAQPRRRGRDRAGGCGPPTLGRQLDLEVAYSRPWAGGSAHMAAVASHDAGHVADKREVSILARYSRRF